MKNREFTFTLATGEKVKGATLSEALSKLSPEEKVRLQKSIDEKEKKIEPEVESTNEPSVNEEEFKEEKKKLFEQQYNGWLIRKQKLESLEIQTQKLREERETLKKEIEIFEKTTSEVDDENISKQNLEKIKNDNAPENSLDKIGSTIKTLEDFSQKNPKEFLDIKKKLKPKYTADAEIFGLMDEKERAEWEHYSATPGKKSAAATLLKNANERFNVIERTPQEVAEEYHKAKLDNSNPELIKAIESLLIENTIESAEKENATIKITKKENIDRGLEKKFVEEAAKDVLVKFFSESKNIRRVDPKKDNFSLESTEEGFVVRAFVSIKTGLKDPKTAIMNLSIPLLNKDGKLDTGGLSIGGGLAIPNEARREVADYLLPSLVGKIKSYFEEKWKTPIKSMRIANDRLVIEKESYGSKK